MAEPTDRRPQPGSLEVRAKALQHIVEQAALEVPGTVVRQTTLGSVRGANSPRASVALSGDRARVEVDVACLWPAPLARVAADVRSRVHERLPELAGIRVVSVDVRVGTAAEETTTSTQSRVA